MNELRLERIEDAILEIALSVQEGDTKDLHNRIGEILFEGNIDDE